MVEHLAGSSLFHAVVNWRDEEERIPHRYLQVLGIHSSKKPDVKSLLAYPFVLLKLAVNTDYLETDDVPAQRRLFRDNGDVQENQNASSASETETAGKNLVEVDYRGTKVQVPARGSSHSNRFVSPKKRKLGSTSSGSASLGPVVEDGAGVVGAPAATDPPLEREVTFGAIASGAYATNVFEAAPPGGIDALDPKAHTTSYARELRKKRVRHLGPWLQKLQIVFRKYDFRIRMCDGEIVTEEQKDATATSRSTTTTTSSSSGPGSSFIYLLLEYQSANFDFQRLLATDSHLAEHNDYFDAAQDSAEAGLQLALKELSTYVSQTAVATGVKLGYGGRGLGGSSPAADHSTTGADQMQNQFSRQLIPHASLSSALLFETKNVKVAAEGNKAQRGPFERLFSMLEAFPQLFRMRAAVLKVPLESEEMFLEFVGNLLYYGFSVLYVSSPFLVGAASIEDWVEGVGNSGNMHSAFDLSKIISAAPPPPAAATSGSATPAGGGLASALASAPRSASASQVQSALQTPRDKSALGSARNKSVAFATETPPLRPASGTGTAGGGGTRGASGASSAADTPRAFGGLSVRTGKSVVQVENTTFIVQGVGLDFSSQPDQFGTASSSSGAARLFNALPALPVGAEVFPDVLGRGRDEITPNYVSGASPNQNLGAGATTTLAVAASPRPGTDTTAALPPPPGSTMKPPPLAALFPRAGKIPAGSSTAAGPLSETNYQVAPKLETFFNDVETSCVVCLEGLHQLDHHVGEKFVERLLVENGFLLVGTRRKRLDAHELATLMGFGSHLFSDSGVEEGREGFVGDAGRSRSAENAPGTTTAPAATRKTLLDQLIGPFHRSLPQHMHPRDPDSGQLHETYHGFVEPGASSSVCLLCEHLAKTRATLFFVKRVNAFSILPHLVYGNYLQMLTETTVRSCVQVFSVVTGRMLGGGGAAATSSSKRRRNSAAAASSSASDAGGGADAPSGGQQGPSLLFKPPPMIPPVKIPAQGDPNYVVQVMQPASGVSSKLSTARSDFVEQPALQTQPGRGGDGDAAATSGANSSGPAAAADKLPKNPFIKRPVASATEKSFTKHVLGHRGKQASVFRSLHDLVTSEFDSNVPVLALTPCSREHAHWFVEKHLYDKPPAASSQQTSSGAAESVGPSRQSGADTAGGRGGVVAGSQSALRATQVDLPPAIANNPNLSPERKSAARLMAKINDGNNSLSPAPAKSGAVRLLSGGEAGGGRREMGAQPGCLSEEIALLQIKVESTTTTAASGGNIGGGPLMSSRGTSRSRELNMATAKQVLRNVLGYTVVSETKQPLRWDAAQLASVLCTGGKAQKDALHQIPLLRDRLSGSDMIETCTAEAKSRVAGEQDAASASQLERLEDESISALIQLLRNQYGDDFFSVNVLVVAKPHSIPEVRAANALREDQNACTLWYTYQELLRNFCVLLSRAAVDELSHSLEKLHEEAAAQVPKSPRGGGLLGGGGVSAGSNSNLANRTPSQQLLFAGQQAVVGGSSSSRVSRSHSKRSAYLNVSKFFAVRHLYLLGYLQMDVLTELLLQFCASHWGEVEKFLTDLLQIKDRRPPPMAVLGPAPAPTPASTTGSQLPTAAKTPSVALLQPPAPSIAGITVAGKNASAPSSRAGSRQSAYDLMRAQIEQMERKVSVAGAGSTLNTGTPVDDRPPSHQTLAPGGRASTSSVSVAGVLKNPTQLAEMVDSKHARAAAGGGTSSSSSSRNATPRSGDVVVSSSRSEADEIVKTVLQEMADAGLDRPPGFVYHGGLVVGPSGGAPGSLTGSARNRAADLRQAVAAIDAAAQAQATAPTEDDKQREFEFKLECFVRAVLHSVGALARSPVFRFSRFDFLPGSYRVQANGDKNSTTGTSGSGSYFDYVVRVTRPSASKDVVGLALSAFRMLYAVRIVNAVNKQASAALHSGFVAFTPRFTLHPRDATHHDHPPECLVGITPASYRPLPTLVNRYKSENYATKKVAMTATALLSMRLTKEGCVVRSPDGGRGQSSVQIGWRLVSSPSFPIEDILKLNREFADSCGETYEKLALQIESFFEDYEDEAVNPGKGLDLWQLMKNSSYSPVRGNRDELTAQAMFQRFKDHVGLVIETKPKEVERVERGNITAAEDAEALQSMFLPGQANAAPLASSASSSSMAPPLSEPLRATTTTQYISLTKFIGVQTLPEVFSRLCLIMKDEARKFPDGIELTFSPDAQLQFGVSKISRRLHARAEVGLFGRKLGQLCEGLSLRYDMQTLVAHFGSSSTNAAIDFDLQPPPPDEIGDHNDRLARKRWKVINEILHTSDGWCRPLKQTLVQRCDPHYHPAQESQSTTGENNAVRDESKEQEGRSSSSTSTSSAAAPQSGIYDEKTGEVIDKKRHTANLLRLHPKSEIEQNTNPLASDATGFLDLAFPTLSNCLVERETSTAPATGDRGSGSSSAGGIGVLREKLCAALGITDLHSLGSSSVGASSAASCASTPGNALDIGMRHRVREFLAREDVKELFLVGGSYGGQSSTAASASASGGSTTSSTSRENYFGYRHVKPEAILFADSQVGSSPDVVLWDQEGLDPCRCMRGRLAAQIWIALRYLPFGEDADSVAASWDHADFPARKDLLHGFKSHYVATSPEAMADGLNANANPDPTATLGSSTSHWTCIQVQAVLVLLELYEQCEKLFPPPAAAAFGPSAATVKRSHIREWLSEVLEEVVGKPSLV